MEHKLSYTNTKIYPSQTKILEGGTNDAIPIFEALFKGVSTRLGLRIVEKSVENLCSPNEDFGRPSKHFRNAFRNTFQGRE
jgi:hypothetical protein